MFRPISSRILKSSVTVSVCTGTDIFQNQIFETYTVSNVFMMPSDTIVKTNDNTDRQLQGMLYVDGRKSVPALDWRALLVRAHDCGGDVKVSLRGVEYTVLSVSEYRDFADKFHHWEIGVA